MTGKRNGRANFNPNDQQVHAGQVDEVHGQRVHGSQVHGSRMQVGQMQVGQVHSTQMQKQRQG